MGCLSFNISVKNTGSMNIKEESEHLNMDVNVKPIGRMSMGFICSTDVGMPVLYASDGALITIDGQYLIVRR